MGDVDKRREAVYGLSGDEARECLAQMRQERVQHEALHRTEPPPVKVSQSSVQHVVTEVLRKMAYGYSDQEAREWVLTELDQLDEHWRKERPEEHEPGIEYFRRVVTEVRRHSR